MLEPQDCQGDWFPNIVLKILRKEGCSCHITTQSKLLKAEVGRAETSGMYLKSFYSWEIHVAVAEREFNGHLARQFVLRQLE